MTTANRRVEVQARRQWQSSLEHAQNAHGTPAIMAFDGRIGTLFCVNWELVGPPLR